MLLWFEIPISLFSYLFEQELTMRTFSHTCIGWLSCIGVVLVLGGCVTDQEIGVVPSHGVDLGCAVGEVTSHEALVWVKTDGSQKGKILYTTDSRWTAPQETFFTSTTAERDFTAHVSLRNLMPQTRYQYRTFISGNPHGPICEFSTAPPSTDLVPVTFVIGGDTRQSFQPFSIMDPMRSAHPDFFIYLGDTIYSDKGHPATTLAEYWGKYAENRDSYLQGLLASTGVFVMWDDHEVENDFTKFHPRMPVGRQAFFDYWPIRKFSQEPNRLYRSFIWGKGVEVFLLDNRQYRDPKGGTMLGHQQKQWLLQKLVTSTATFKFIVSSVPFSDPRDDKWGEYPEERDEILNTIQENKIPGVIFLAGDVHHAAVSRMPHDPSIREFIFGPLAAPMNFTISSSEPRFEFFNAESPNYGKVTVNLEGPSPSVRVEWFDISNTLLHQVDFGDGQNFSSRQQ